MNFCWTGVSLVFVVSVISVFTEFTDIEANCQQLLDGSLAAAGGSINNQPLDAARG
jgi:hypothetical protein